MKSDRAAASAYSPQTMVRMVSVNCVLSSNSFVMMVSMNCVLSSEDGHDDVRELCSVLRAWAWRCPSSSPCTTRCSCTEATGAATPSAGDNCGGPISPWTWRTCTLTASSAALREPSLKYSWLLLTTHSLTHSLAWQRFITYIQSQLLTWHKIRQTHARTDTHTHFS